MMIARDLYVGGGCTMYGAPLNIQLEIISTIESKGQQGFTMKVEDKAMRTRALLIY